MESKHLSVGGSNVRQQGLSCKIHKAKTQNPRAWADKVGIHSLVKLRESQAGEHQDLLFTLEAKFQAWNLSCTLYPAKTKTPVLIYNVLAGVCHFFLLIPGLPIQFISNLKNTQVKRKGKACLECVLTPGGVTWEGMKTGWVIERSPEPTMRQEGSRAYYLMLLSWVTGEAAQWSQDTQDNDPNGLYSCGR